MLELIVSLFIPYNILQNSVFEFRVNYKICEMKINYILYSIFIIQKIWYLFRFSLYVSYYSKPRAQRFCAMYNVEISIFFTIKCIMKKYPKFYLILGSLSLLLTGSFLLQIWERIGIVPPNYSFDNYFNCIWYSFSTMAILSFGELYATSLVGRIVSAFLVIKGLIIIATLTAILRQLFRFGDGDLKAFQNLNEVKDLMRLKTIKQQTIYNTIRANFFYNSYEKAKQDKNNKKIKVYEKLWKFYQSEYMRSLQEQREVKE